MELCDECNNFEKFQFYTEKVMHERVNFCDFTSLCVHIVMSVTVLALWMAPPEMFCNWYRI